MDLGHGVGRNWFDKFHIYCELQKTFYFFIFFMLNCYIWCLLILIWSAAVKTFKFGQESNNFREPRITLSIIMRNTKSQYLKQMMFREQHIEDK